VLRRYVDASERSLERSTWLDYRRSVDSHLIPHSAICIYPR
jgi:hypothetical protein